MKANYLYQTSKGIYSMKKLMFLCISVLTGCSSLNSVLMTPGDQKSYQGFDYQLTFTQFDVTVTRQLESCTGGISFDTKVVLVPHEKLDKDQRYYIDARKLQSWLKSTEIKIEYFDNTRQIKSINASADDKSAEVIANAATIAGKVVAYSLAAGSNASPPPLECSDVAVGLLKSVELKTSNLKRVIEDYEDLNEKFELLIAKRSAAGKYWTKENSTELLEIMDKVNIKKLEFEAATEAVKTASKERTIIDSAIWPEKSTDTLIGELPFKISKEAAEKFIKNAKMTAIEKDNNYTDSAALFLKIKGVDATSVDCLKITLPTESCIKKMNKIAENSEGFKYRIPMKAVVTVQEKINGKTVDVGENEFQISQIGDLMSIPFKSYPFSKKEFGVTFTEQGIPTVLTSKSDASAPKIMSAIGDVVDSAVSIKTSKESKELNTIKNKTELLKANKDLADAEKLLNPEPKSEKEKQLNTLASETALLEAEIANIKARKTLEEAKNNPITSENNDE